MFNFLPTKSTLSKPSRGWSFKYDPALQQNILETELAINTCGVLEELAITKQIIDPDDDGDDDDFEHKTANVEMQVKVINVRKVLWSETETRQILDPDDDELFSDA